MNIRANSLSGFKSEHGLRFDRVCRLSWIIGAIFLLLPLGGVFAMDTPRSSTLIDSLSNEPKDTLTLGPFEPSPATAFYVVLDEHPASVRVTVRQSSRNIGDRVMLRAYDPDEQLIHWQYAEWGQTHKQSVPSEGQILLDKNIHLKPSGVNQIRVTCGERNVLVTVTLPRDLQWGISAQNGLLKPWPGQPKEMYLYIPPQAEEVWGLGWGRIGNDPVIRIFDDLGKEVVYPDGVNAKSIPIERTEVVWKLVFSDSEKWELGIRFFPFILCPTRKAAEAIHGSVVKLPDGTVVAHKFQKRIAELLPKLLKPELVGNSKQLIQQISSKRDEFTSDPLKKYWMVDRGSFLPAVREALLVQNVDPASPWAGAMVGTKPKSKLPLRYEKVDGFCAGYSPDHYGYEESLALAALTKDPANPYYGKKELIYRAVASSLKNLMRLNEAEVWPEVAHSPYPGLIAFSMGQKTFPAFGALAQNLPSDMPPEAKELWAEGLRRLVDRTFADYLCDTRNQSAHFLVAYNAFAQGTEDPLYSELAKEFVRRFCKTKDGFNRQLGMSPAGYPAEGMGPDSYADMSHWHMAVAYRMIPDPLLLDALQKSYRFFNHTVAPEPDGTLIGASNFCHRTAGWFARDAGFWGGARGIADDLVPEVGIWKNVQNMWLLNYFPDQYTNSASMEKAKQRALGEIDKLIKGIDSGKIKPSWPLNKFPRYQYYADKPDLSGIWPAQEKEDFIRDFGNEMIAVKRPGYYAVVYVGKPAVDAYMRDRKKFEKPDSADDTGKEQYYRTGFPMNGGGLSLFWTESYGTSIVGMNWSPYTHHGLIALSDDKKRITWEDYQTVEHFLDAQSSTLEISGKITGQPLNYSRKYIFGPQSVEVRLVIKADNDCVLNKFVENIPLLSGKFKRDDVQIFTDAETIVLRNIDSAGVTISLSNPLSISLGLNGRELRDVKINRGEISLPLRWKAGDTFGFSYEIVPL